MTTPTKGRRAAGKRKLETVDRYMDAAEALFIRLGYEGTSMRAISARAGLALATVVYHWGTKEALFRAICIRRFQDIQAEQSQRLRAIASKGDAVGPDDLTEVLKAFVEPPLLMHKSAKEGRIIRTLYGRVLTDPSPTMARVIIELFKEDSDLYRSLLRKCLPDLEEATFFRRYTCALGAFAFTQSFGYRVSDVSRISALQSDWRIVADEIIDFMRDGLTGATTGQAVR